MVMNMNPLCICPYCITYYIIALVMIIVLLAETKAYLKILDAAAIIPWLVTVIAISGLLTVATIVRVVLHGGITL